VKSASKKAFSRLRLVSLSDMTFSFCQSDDEVYHVAWPSVGHSQTVRVLIDL